LTDDARTRVPHELSIGQTEIVRKYMSNCESQAQSRPVWSFQRRSQVAVQESTDDVNSIVEALKQIPTPRA
jgi:hypothetical protein